MNTTNGLREHVGALDGTGTAVRCSCGAWAMLLDNFFRWDAWEAHREHAANPVEKEGA